MHFTISHLHKSVIINIFYQYINSLAYSECGVNFLSFRAIEILVSEANFYSK